jgi:RNA polymerase sigma-70 factor (ECF subfamily)
MADSLNQLVKALQAGDMSAFDELYQQTYRKVFFIVLPILKDRSLAEDIMQDTYIRLLESIGTYRERNFLAYLLTIAKNLAINEYHKRKHSVLTDTIELDKSAYSLINHVEIQIEKADFIRESLSVLDENERNVVLLYTLENLTHREIAFILDKPLGTITWIYSKAIKKIRKKVKEES